jgi:glycerophosphoryl diester phosphodiesterase
VRGLRSVRFAPVTEVPQVDRTTTPLEWLRRRPERAPLVVAHRGASADAPENTLAAFSLAMTHGAQLVECDVHLSTDGVPVVIHDETLDRTTDGTGPVSALTLSQLKALDAGGWKGARFSGERIPTLDETLALCAGRARVFVELKRGGGPSLVDAALASIARAGCDVAVISFGPNEVGGVAQARPDLPLGFLVGKTHLDAHGVARATEMARELGADFISPQEQAVDVAFIAASHGAGLPVSVWTVDDPERMRALASYGIDALTTNCPGVALRLFS